MAGLPHLMDTCCSARMIPEARIIDRFTAFSPCAQALQLRPSSLTYVRSPSESPMLWLIPNDHYSPTHAQATLVSAQMSGYQQIPSDELQEMCFATPLCPSLLNGASASTDQNQRSRASQLSMYRSLWLHLHADAPYRRDRHRANGSENNCGRTSRRNNCQL